MTTLYSSLTTGALALQNRFVMAPMSRNRATADGLATALMAQYYAQRAGAGLMISEGIQPNITGQGFMHSPGLHNQQQADSWRAVTTAVHRQGGLIVAQLMHAGRIGHPSLYASAHQSLAPSAVAANGFTYTAAGPQPYPVPRAMNSTDIRQTIVDFASAAKFAIDAGFDGVEIHAGNGFLLHQFMADNTNLRSDSYGGSVQNRLRLTLEVTAAVVAAIGAGRTGIRLSPENPYNDIREADALMLYPALCRQLPADLAYLHIMETGNRDMTALLRQMWAGCLIVNPHQSTLAGAVTPAIASEILQQGLADAVAFGALFLANPDLVARSRQGGPYNQVDPSTFYGGGAAGYTDYPTLAEQTPMTALNRQPLVLG
ncbi:alkene reductase [Rheinheimera sp. SA_1]|uniref:alkene reductase n=1 Tax=Rheinheimera sp. SA_1 TaxID=1827365 RepID=UPI0007FE50AE|nr:alkene reductase [Rheinheimera sp. SA_1]OBP16292.1 alkene reductase [Rheinheimera sp. SA_1]